MKVLFYLLLLISVSFATRKRLLSRSTNDLKKELRSQSQSSVSQLYFCQGQQVHNPNYLRIRDEIISQIKPQIEGDNLATMEISETNVEVITSLPITLQNISIEYSTEMIPFSITSYNEINLFNVSILNKSYEPGEDVILKPIDSLYSSWMQLTAPRVNVQNITIAGQQSKTLCTQRGVLNITNSQQVNVTQFNIEQYMRPAIILSQIGTVYLNSINATNNDIMSDVNFIWVDYVSLLFLNNSQFNSNCVSVKSMIYFTNTGVIQLSNIQFDNNILLCSSVSMCSIIQSMFSDQIGINNSNVTNNYAVQGFVFMQSTQTKYTSLTGVYFSQNIYNDVQIGGLMRISSKDSTSNAVIQQCIFESNGSGSIETAFHSMTPDVVSNNNAIQLDVPSVSLSQSSFLNNQGGVFDMMNTANLQINNSNFTSNVGYKGSAISIRANAFSSNLKVNYSVFVNNAAMCTMQGNGGAIKFDYMTSLSIQNSMFIGNSANPGLYGGAIYFSEVEQIIIANTVFANNSATMSGGAIYGRIVSGSISMNNVTFDQNTAGVDGGAIRLLKINWFDFISSTATRNTAMQNGGLLSTNLISDTMNIYRSNITGNSAVSSIGGAIFVNFMLNNLVISRPNITQNNAKLGGFLGANYLGQLTVNQIPSSSAFSSNNAMIGGGIFGYLQNGPDSVSPGTDLYNAFQQLKNNPSLQSGNGIFNTPNSIQFMEAFSYQDVIDGYCGARQQLAIKLLPAPAYDPNSSSGEDPTDGNSNYIPTYLIENVNSNSIVELQLQLLDFYGQIIQRNNSFSLTSNETNTNQRYLATMQIIPNNSSNTSEENDEDSVDEDNEESSNNLRLLDEDYQNSGCFEQDINEFNFNYRVLKAPNTTMTTLFTFLPQMQQYIQVKLIWKFRPCVEGEIIITQGDVPICYACPMNTYSLSNPYQGASCLTIPSVGVEASYKNILELKMGFWRESSQSGLIVECVNQPRSCEGGELVGDNMCKQGHIGPLCEQCDLYGTFWNKSYMMTMQNTCEECTNMTWDSVKLVVLCLGMITFSTLMSWSIYQNAKAFMQGHYIKKIGLCLIGTTAIDQNLYFVYSKIFMNFMQMQQILLTFQIQPYGIFSFFMNTIGSPTQAALMSFDCYLKTTQVESILFTKIIIVALFPVALVIIILLVMNILFMIGVISYEKRYRIVFSTLIFWLLYVLQFNVVKFLLQAQSCRTIGTQEYAYLDLNLSCSNDKLSTYKLLIVYPLIAVWTVVFAALLFGLVWRYKPHLRTRVKSQFMLRFLLCEFKPTFFFWEFVRMVKRILLTFIYTQFYADKTITGLVASLILLIYYSAVVKLRPFQKRTVNYLESESVFITVVTLFLSMVYENLSILSNSSGIDNTSPYFWQQSSLVAGTLAFLIQSLNVTFVLKYIYFTLLQLKYPRMLIDRIHIELAICFPKIFTFKTKPNVLIVSKRWMMIRFLVLNGQYSLTSLKKQRTNVDISMSSEEGDDDSGKLPSFLEPVMQRYSQQSDSRQQSLNRDSNPKVEWKKTIRSETEPLLLKKYGSGMQHLLD